MSKLETNTIDTVSGTNTLTIGSTNTSTIDFSNPANVTLNAAMKNQHLFFAADSSGITMNNGVSTKMIYGTEIFDLSSAYNTTNGRFTAPEAGYYFFFANWRAPVGSGTNCRCDTSFYKNGTAAGAIGGMNQTNSNDYASYGTLVSNLNANDYIEVYGNQNSGANVSTSNGNNAGSGGTGFLGYKIIT
jgi:hypothetical protein